LDKEKRYLQKIIMISKLKLKKLEIVVILTRLTNLKINENKFKKNIGKLEVNVKEW